jgi:hypothetical protein
MGFLCAAGLRSEATPPVSIVGPEYPDEAWPVFRGMITDDRGHWQPVFERRSSAEKRALAPMLCGLAIAQAFRRQDFSAMHGALVAAKRFGLPMHPFHAAATDTLHALGAGMRVYVTPQP